MSERSDVQRTAPATTAGISEEAFASADPQALYASMRPDQRTAIANEFVRLLTLAGDDEGQRIVSGVASPGRMDSAEQVSALHTYVAGHAPDILAQVWRHPVTQFALAHAGAAPVREVVDERERKRVAEALRPTENVAMTGSGYVSGGMMVELGGEHAQALIEDPQEWAVRPQGEIETDQPPTEAEEEAGPAGND